jgi:hypothetical protein
MCSLQHKAIPKLIADGAGVLRSGILTKKVKLRCSWSVAKSVAEVDGAAVMETNWDRRAGDDALMGLIMMKELASFGDLENLP